MSFSIERKQRFINLILCRIDEFIRAHGQQVPCHFPGAAKNALVVDLPPLRIERLPDRFRTYAAKSRNMISEALLEREGWDAIEVRVHNERRLCVNVGPDEVVFYHWQPGNWESIYFGVDPQGDTIPIRPELFADDKNPYWRAFDQSSLSSWPPRFR